MKKRAALPRSADGRILPNTPAKQKRKAAERRQRLAASSRWQSVLIAEIGVIPQVREPERRAACERDLERFLATYFPRSTGLSPFSDDHKRVIGRIQTCILSGGQFVEAVYRGFAKTTISENATIWAVLYGHRKFGAVFSSERDSAAAIIDSIKLELGENDLLLADFPEACYPIRLLENKPMRCASQTHEGRLTHSEWRADTIVLPTIRLRDALTPASGAIIASHGIMAASRGMKHKRPDGTQQRPDVVIVDDPQTDESASTALQVAKRLNVIRKSIMKLGGHNKKTACVVNATVIRPDDLIEQLLDAKRFPSWQGERIPMVRQWAGRHAHEKLWLGEYARLRNGYDRNTIGDQQRAWREATDFYQRNRQKMDDGVEVSWQSCYDRDFELSSVQHAYNLLIDDGEEVFASECQQAPLKQQHADDDGLALNANDVIAKLNLLKRGLLPGEASRLVAFIDPKKEMLFWSAGAFSDGFNGAVVDYGTHPDQRRSYFSARKARHTLGALMPGDSWEAALYAGLESLVNQLMTRDWMRDDGALLRPERILIDANWGEATDTVYQFCRHSPHAAVLLPSHGRFIGATSRPFNDFRAKPGDRSGLNWRIPFTGKHAVRHVVFDANAWKTFSISRLLTPPGGHGCLSLFGEEQEEHRLFADHVCAEKPIVVEARGRRVVEWKQNPLFDNDYLDCLVGLHVAASVQGVHYHQRRPAAVERKPRRSLADVQRQARRWDASQKKWITR